MGEQIVELYRKCVDCSLYFFTSEEAERAKKYGILRNFEKIKSSTWLDLQNQTHIEFIIDRSTEPKEESRSEG